MTTDFRLMEVNNDLLRTISNGIKAQASRLTRILTVLLRTRKRLDQDLDK